VALSFRCLFYGCIFASLSMLLTAYARAEVEYCPAELAGAGAAHGSVYPFMLKAGSVRTVSGSIIAQGENGWYTFPFANAALAPDVAHYQTAYDHYDRTFFYSKPLYVRFPAGEKLVRWWVSEASATGDSVFSWDAKGDVTCLPEPGTDYRPEGESTEATRTNPVAEIPWPDPSEIAAVGATPMSAPQGMTACDKPFSPAVGIHIVHPEWPTGFSRTSAPHAELTTKIAIALNADSTVADTWVVQPTGVPELDIAALNAAHNSKYRAGTALCRPAAGTYLFVSTFDN
jgi:hypothetical protein